MQKKILQPDQIGRVLKENLNKKDTVFVFSTETDMNSWAEWCVKKPEESGVKAVGMQHFMAWDDFKRQFVVAKEEGKQAVPALLRKVFVNNLLYENDQAVAQGKEPLLKSLIAKQFASDGYSFCDWISKNLTSLKMWHDRFEKWSQNHSDEIDDEDRDYLFIYESYVKFLGDTMFEPAWVTPDFSGNSSHFIIFYPEQFADFDEYEELLTIVENVEIYCLPESDKSGNVYCYPDARQELRRTALLIRKKISEGVHSEEIAVHVPDLQTYRPYIQREFKNYCITYVLHSGEDLTVSNAGSIFENISDCFKNNFSYDSMRSLLMNSFVPWLKPEVNRNLVKAGQELHLICNYLDGRDNDVWTAALKATSNSNQRELKLYVPLRDFIEKFNKAETFGEIQALWFGFKKKFFSEEFTEHADNILSRCLKTLSDLISLERDYIIPRGLRINNHYQFFLNELKDGNYVSQQKKSGVSVFDYKVAACAAFKYNFVINCSQNAVTVMPKKLGFLNSIKREKLGITDKDKASTAYLRLYGKFNSAEEENTVYSCSENSFSGYAIPHNSLVPVELEKGRTPFEELDEQDFNLVEKAWFINGCRAGSTEPAAVSKEQAEQLENWISINSGKQENGFAGDEDIKAKIDFVLTENRKTEGVPDDVMKITQSDMRNFFPCPRKWMLTNVLKLEDETLKAELFNYYDQGNINHKILELLFAEWGKLPVLQEDGTFGKDEKQILSTITRCTKAAIDSPELKFEHSPLVYMVLNAQVSDFVDIIMSFLRKICVNQEEGGYGGCKVYSTEKWLAAKSDYSEYALSGKVDCILTNDNDEVIIVDYKSSKAPAVSGCRVNDNGELKDFQCAMYVQLWNMGKDSVKVSRMDFRVIKDGSVATILGDRKGAKNKLTSEEYEKTIETFNGYTDLFYDKVKNYRLIPLTESKIPAEVLDVNDDCRNCGLKSVCRTCYTVAGNRL